MSDEATGDQDKQHDPTQKRLDDARRRGEVPRSPDLTTAMVYGGFLLALATTGKQAVTGLGSVGAGFLAKADHIEQMRLHGALSVISYLLSGVVWSVWPLFVLPLLGAVTSLTIQRNWIFTPENLTPKLTRISPFGAIRKKFGLDGLTLFGKSTLKMGVIAGLLVLFLLNRIDGIAGVSQLSPTASVLVLAAQMMDFISLVCIVALVFGAIDLLWQRLRHSHRNRMSRKELVDEHKESEGDPHVKSQRRQRAQAIAMNQMLSDVGTADVIIVNPTHYAVALKWERTKHRAPVCVAKGTDEIAARIRERASEAGVPIHHDPPTARALFATIEIGQEIRHEQYRAVASAIRFALAMRNRVKAMRR